MNPLNITVLTLIILIELVIVLSALKIRNDSIQGNIFGTRVAEIIWTLLPILLIAVLVVFSYDSLESK